MSPTDYLPKPATGPTSWHFLPSPQSFCFVSSIALAIFKCTNFSILLIAPYSSQAGLSAWHIASAQ